MTRTFDDLMVAICCCQRINISSLLSGDLDDVSVVLINISLLLSADVHDVSVVLIDISSLLSADLDDVSVVLVNISSLLSADLDDVSVVLVNISSLLSTNLAFHTKTGRRFMKKTLEKLRAQLQRLSKPDHWSMLFMLTSSHACH